MVGNHVAGRDSRQRVKPEVLAKACLEGERKGEDILFLIQKGRLTDSSRAVLCRLQWGWGSWERKL